jgi:competence protein ComEA
MALIFLAGLAILSAGGPGRAAAQKKPPAKPINLNTATLEQLEQLPGVGPVTAKDILEFRRKSGPFRSVNDLLAVRRITKARLEKLRPYVTVGPAPSAAKQKPA